MKSVYVGVITHNRPSSLERLLDSLAQQPQSPDYKLHVIVVDNDGTGRNQTVVDTVREKTGLDIIFTTEEKSGIPYARNKSVRLAIEHRADFFIFVDDDEIVPQNWLEHFMRFYDEFKSDISTGPVKGILPHNNIPSWASKSEAYDKVKKWSRGQIINRAYTNNTMITQSVLFNMGEAFHEKFSKSGSSDRHYFRLAVLRGYTIRWCPEVIVHENIPLKRISYIWILKRSFRSGAGDTISNLLISNKPTMIIKIIAFSFARAGLGIVFLISSPFTGWKGIIGGSKRMASSLGSLLGLVGINYNEYAKPIGE